MTSRLASPNPGTWTRLLSHCRQPRGPGVTLSPTTFSPSCSSRHVRRRYHSYDHPPTPAEPFNDAERAILAAAYAHVPSLGFTLAALTRGATDAGYRGISTAALQHGQNAFSLIRYHLVTRREALAGRSKELFREEAAETYPKVSEKVEALSWERLMGNREVIHKWQEVCPSSALIPPANASDAPARQSRRTTMHAYEQG